MTNESASAAAAKEARLQRAAQARTLLAKLAERYPACFTRDPAKTRPLAIGTQQTLRAALAEDAELAPTPAWQLRQALAIYTRSIAYLTAITERRPRIHLDGSAAGAVTDQEQAHASARLAEAKARRDARRSAGRKQGNRRGPAERQISSEERTHRKLERLAAKYSRK